MTTAPPMEQPASGWVVIAADRISAGLRESWLALLRANPKLDSPYFHPGFTESLVSNRRQVWLAVLMADGAPKLLLPFQRRGSRGQPAGTSMSDFHAPIAAPGTTFDASGFMRVAELGTLHFKNWLNDNPAPDFAQYGLREATAPYLDVEGGAAAYKSRLSARNKEVFADTLRSGRKLEREVAPLRFEWQAPLSVLDTLFEWKSRQYRETGAMDFFADESNRRYFQELLQRRGDSAFEGVLSALWAGEKLLAVHAGMRAGPVLHWWFPTYNTEFSRYSPGRLLITKHIEQADTLGLKRIDLGKGDEPYKRWLMTGEAPLLEGVIDLDGSRRWLRRTRVNSRDAIRASNAFGWARNLKRRLLKR